MDAEKRVFEEWISVVFWSLSASILYREHVNYCFKYCHTVLAPPLQDLIFPISENSLDYLAVQVVMVSVDCMIISC